MFVKIFNFLMMKKIGVLLLVFQTSFLLAQAPSIQWQKSLGGTGIEKANTVIQTSDGGYIAGGYATSNNGDVTGAHGGNDCWIVKLDTAGTLVWQKTYGGTGHEGITSILELAEGGYIVSASSASSDGDVSDSNGGGDMWILKLDAVGNLLWEKSFGGTSSDNSSNIRQTTDGGFVVAGTASSYNGDVVGQHGNADAWVIKIDALGNLVWQNALGGNSLDFADDIQQTTDGGYIVCGTNTSTNGDATFNYGITDYWILKLDTAGNLVWQKSFGGSNTERAYAIRQTIDGGYVIVGSSTSSDGNVTGSHGSNDVWVVKLNATGTLIWQKALGGAGVDLGRGIYQNADGSYIVGGYSASTDGDVTGNHGDKDAWIAKLTTTGTLVWQKSVGGSGIDEAYDIEMTSDGHQVLAGNSFSSNGDATVNNGDADYWIVKMGPILSTDTFSISTLKVFPNPANDRLTVKIDYFEPSQEITITDVLGKTIHVQKLEGLTTLVEVSSLPNGIYFLSLMQGDTTLTQKFIKE